MPGKRVNDIASSRASLSFEWLGGSCAISYIGVRPIVGGILTFLVEK